MNSFKIFLYYPIVISVFSHGMELDLHHQAREQTGVESEEYVVLFRGNHFSDEMDAGQVAAVNYLNPEPVDSRYVSLSRQQGTVDQKRVSALQKLAQLRSSGPYTSQAQLKTKKKVIPYSSAYHWLQELYVNKYADFKKQLTDDESELSKLLKKYELSFDDIFFVSTSLNCLTAVKYGLGLCSGSYRNWPVWMPKDVKKHATLGYLDIFIVPRKDLASLGAFPVVEEFASHNIQLPYEFKQKDYTVAEEYVFPLSIPLKYHRKRIALTVNKKRKAKKDDFIEGFMRRQAKKITEKLSNEVTQLVSAERGKRVFLYLLRNRLDSNETVLKPADAISLNKKVAPLLIKTYSEIEASGRTSQKELSLPSSIAIERAINASGALFSLQFNDFSKSFIKHIAALVKQKNVSSVIVGTKRETESIAEQCLGMGDDRYDEDPANLNSVMLAASKRDKPITFCIAFIIAPQYHRVLDAIERGSHYKIRFVYDRQNYDAQEFECIEAEALHDVSDDVKEMLFPTCFSVETVVEAFVGQVENLVDEFSSGLDKCNTFDSLDSSYTLEEELLIEDNDRPDTYLPGEAIDFIKKYKKRVRNLDFDDLFGEALDDEPEAEGDLFYECYVELEEKFSNKVTGLIKMTAERLEDMVEYSSGDVEESYSIFDQEEPADSVFGDDESSSSANKKRMPARTIDSLHVETMQEGFILKKRALIKQ